MPPRDLLDANPVFEPGFWWSYMDILRLIGFVDDPEEDEFVILEIPELIPIEEEDEVPELEDWGDGLHLLPTLTQIAESVYWGDS